ncbi:TPA: hypothetical protein ACH3X2_010974 [Trebouxia sp. C0005]
MHSRLERPGLSNMTVIYVYVLLLIATWPCVTALRGHTPADYKFADALWTKAALPEVTSYGQPVGELLAKPTSVDHFGSVQYTRNDTYELRYALIWPVDAPNASTPIFLFCAQESPITSVAPGSGFYSSLANSTAALQIWPEHRYYAEAEPYTPADDFAHFTIEQSLVDHIELVLYVQNVYNLTTNPVIAIGSSYSGQLSQYLRIRYPDVIAGAISSSPTSFGCPGLGLDPSYDPYGFAKVATRAASSEGGSADACPSNVQDFFQTIFSLANTLDGLNQINTDMQLCSDSQVSSYDQVNGTLAQYVQGQWVSAAQYNAPIANVGTLGVPAYRVRVACDLLSDSSLAGSDLLAAMVDALAVFTANASIANGCLDITGAPQQSLSLSLPGQPQHQLLTLLLLRLQLPQKLLQQILHSLS